MTLFNKMNAQRKGKPFADRCSTWSFWLLCLFIVECSISGGGHYLAIGPLTPRIVIGAAAVLLSLPEIFRRLRYYLSRPTNYAVLAFVVWLAVCAVRGYRAGNHMGVLASDLKGFAWLILVPVFCAVITDRKRLNYVLTCVLIGATVQAGIVLIFNCVCSLIPSGIQFIYNPVKDSLFGTVSSVSSRIYRIFTKSSPYMIAACVIVLFRQMRAPKLKWYYIALLALYIDALMLSFTRSLYGATVMALALSAIVAVVAEPKNLRKIAAFLLAGIVTCCAVIAVQEFVHEANYFSFAVARTTGIKLRDSYASRGRAQLRKLWQDGGSGATGSEPEHNAEEQAHSEENDRNTYLELTNKSDALRATTLRELGEMITRSPIIGNGLGASAPSRAGADEYFYHDMLARTGVIGLLLYLLPFGYVWLWVLRRWKRLRGQDAVLSALCAMSAFWIATWFNPWMNAVLGIAWYAVVLTIPNISDLLEERTA